MRKRSRIVFAIALVAIVGGLTWLVLRPRPSEPIYEGKPLRVWLEEFDLPFSGSGNLQRRRKAEEAVRNLGTNTFPTLLRMLMARDSARASKLIELTQKQHILKFNFIPAPDQNRRAVYAFRALGTNAVPPLIQIYNSNESASTKSQVAYALACIGPTAKTAIPHLATGATNQSMLMRCSAITALGEIQSRPEIVVPILIKALSDSDPMVRICAAFQLKQFGDGAKPAVPALTKLVNDAPDPDTRTAALQALSAIDPEAAAKAGVK